MVIIVEGDKIEDDINSNVAARTTQKRKGSSMSRSVMKPKSVFPKKHIFIKKKGN